VQVADDAVGLDRFIGHFDTRRSESGIECGEGLILDIQAENLNSERSRRRPAYDHDLGGGPIGSIIFTTSGTTKAPKFVLHDHYSVVAHANAVARSFGYDAPGTVLLQALPLCGGFGFCQAMAALAGGAVIVMQPTFEAEETAPHKPGGLTLERIAPNDAMILPHGAKPDRVKFSERAGLDRPTFQRFDEAKPGLPSHQRCA
jgi:hypothetical protein